MPESRLLRGGQGCKDLLGSRLAVDYGQWREPDLSGPEHKARLPRRLFHPRGHLLASGLDALHGFFHALPIVVALEGPGNVPTHCLDQLVHVSGQDSYPAAGQTDGDGLGGVLKVVNISPVGGNGLVKGQPFYMPAHGGVPACARRPRYEEVETRGVDPQGKLQCAFGPLLAKQPLKRRYLIGSFKPQVVRVEVFFQRVEGDLQPLYSHLLTPCFSQFCLAGFIPVP